VCVTEIAVYSVGKGSDSFQYDALHHYLYILSDSIYEAYIRLAFFGNYPEEISAISFLVRSHLNAVCAASMHGSNDPAGYDPLYPSMQPHI
jgi:hypothetical protein